MQILPPQSVFKSMWFFSMIICQAQYRSISCLSVSGSWSCRPSRGHYIACIFCETATQNYSKTHARWKRTPRISPTSTFFRRRYHCWQWCTGQFGSLLPEQQGYYPLCPIAGGEAPEHMGAACIYSLRSCCRWCHRSVYVVSFLFAQFLFNLHILVIMSEGVQSQVGVDTRDSHDLQWASSLFALPLSIWICSNHLGRI